MFTKCFFLNKLFKVCSMGLFRFPVEIVAAAQFSKPLIFRFVKAAAKGTTLTVTYDSAVARNVLSGCGALGVGLQGAACSLEADRAAELRHLAAAAAAAGHLGGGLGGASPSASAEAGPAPELPGGLPGVSGGGFDGAVAAFDAAFDAALRGGAAAAKRSLPALDAFACGEPEALRDLPTAQVWPGSPTRVDRKARGFVCERPSTIRFAVDSTEDRDTFEACFDLGLIP